MQKRVLLLSAAAIAMGVASPVFAAQSDFPMPPIQKILPYPAGDGPDLFVRSLAPGMNEDLGQPLVVKNSPGAGGTISARYGSMSAPADGHAVRLGDVPPATPGQFAVHVQAETARWAHVTRTHQIQAE